MGGCNESCFFNWLDVELSKFLRILVEKLNRGEIKKDLIEISSASQYHYLTENPS
jgi:hypothetical protein